MSAETQKELEQLKKRFQDLAEKSYRQNVFAFTGFLSWRSRMRCRRRWEGLPAEKDPREAPVPKQTASLRSGEEMKTARDGWPVSDPRKSLATRRISPLPR